MMEITHETLTALRVAALANKYQPRQEATLTAPLLAHLNGLSDDDLRTVQAIMYFGRDVAQFGPPNQESWPGGTAQSYFDQFAGEAREQVIDAILGKFLALRKYLLAGLQHLPVCDKQARA